MAAPTMIAARPELLARFQATAGGMAEGLEVRRGALGEAVHHHFLRTGAEYRVDGQALVDDVRRLAVGLRDLGDWVAAVGGAFEAAGRPVFDGLVLVPALTAAVVRNEGRPADDDGAGLLEQGVGLVAAALGVGVRAVSAPDPGDLPIGGSAGPLVDVAAAGRAGLAEGAHRWHAEPDRDPIDRASRAAVDGLFAAGGTYGGAAAGAYVGSLVCGTLPVAAPACAAAASSAGSWLGRQALEWVSDRVLGPEPELGAAAPEVVAAEVADIDADAVAALQPVVDAAAAHAAEAAAAHADFVVDHRWRIDPDVPAPPPAPALPPTGPR